MQDYTFNFEDDEELSPEVAEGTVNESAENKLESDVEVETKDDEDKKTESEVETKTEEDNEIETNKDNSDKEVVTETIVEDEREVDTDLDDLKEIEDIISKAISDEETDSGTDQSETLKKANNLLGKVIKENENLKYEVANLKITKQEDNRPDEIIVLQHNWGKAKSGDNEAINKIKQVMFDSLNLRLDPKKDIILSNEIISSNDSIDVDTSDPLSDIDVGY